MNPNPEPTEKATKEVPCPDCYGGHFKPCNICGDSGVATVYVKEEPKPTEEKKP